MLYEVVFRKVIVMFFGKFVSMSFGKYDYVGYGGELEIK